MQITIRPDPDCIELIRSEFKDMVIGFLQSVGIPKKNIKYKAKKRTYGIDRLWEAFSFDSNTDENIEIWGWLATHTFEINENAPQLLYVFGMQCYLPDKLFTKPEWVFEFSKEKHFISLVISGCVICCNLSNTEGLKTLPKNLLNLRLNTYQVETLNENFQQLKTFVNLKSISFFNCTSLKDISLLDNLINLQRLALSNCKSLTDTSGLSGLVNLQTLDLSNCESLTDINGLSGLVNLQSLDLSNSKSLTDISGLSGLVNMQSLDLSNCKSLTDISGLSGLISLKNLSLRGFSFLTDISSLSRLVNLQMLDLSWCESLTGISGLSGLLNLQSLNLKDCKSLTDISSLTGLYNLQTLILKKCKLIKSITNFENIKNLQTLDLSECNSLTEVSLLSGLSNCQILDLHGCGSLTNVNGLSGLINLKVLDLSYCKKIADIDSLKGLVGLLSVNLNECWSLTNINFISNLINLHSLYLRSCWLIKDISGLSKLKNLKKLDLRDCRLITDINSLWHLINLQNLDLGRCYNLENISALFGLKNLQTLDLHGCNSLTDISSLSGLVNLQSIDISGSSIKDIWDLIGLFKLEKLNLGSCQLLTDIDGSSELLNLQKLDLEGCKRIQNYSSLRKCLALKELQESKMHPAELAELLCFLAVQRNDIIYISNEASSWLKELELGFDQNHPSTNDLACSLAQGIVLANLDEVGLSFHQTLLNHPNLGISPWKIWFSENLKTFGWDKIQKLAELNKPSELTFGAIGGISSCLPSLEGDPTQIAWAKKWISEIHSLHNNNPNFLKPAAAEWCLALKRLGEDKLLREWIEKFTDPSDPFALDPINKVFSAYALDINDSESALEYALKINDAKLRDESILNLAQQFIKEGKTTKSGEFLFLLTQVESRTQFAYWLAEDAAYLKNDENAHRLLAACGDNPQSLASILDKLRLANPDSEILKIMHEKLSDESRSEIPASLIMKTSNIYTNTLLKIKDPSQLEKIQQAIESIMKSS